MGEGGHKYFFGSHPEMPWRNEMASAKLLKMFNAIMQDVQKGAVDWAEVEDLREDLVDIDAEIDGLRAALDETTDALANCEAALSDLDDDLVEDLDD